MTWGTLRGQAVLALAGAVRMGRGQGPDDRGWALSCTQILGKNTVFGVPCHTAEPWMSLLSPLSNPLCPSRGSKSRGTQMSPALKPQGSATGRGGGGGKNTKVSGGGSLQVKFHGSSPGRSLGRGDQAKETHVGMLRGKLLLSPFPRGGNGGYKKEL